MKRVGVVIALLSGLLVQAQDRAVVIRNVTIHPVSGPEITNGTIVIQDGRIVDVGTRVSTPKGARVIDAKGLRAYP